MKQILFSFFIGAMLFLSGCSGGINIFPKSKDVQLGQQVQAEIAKDPAHYPVLNNPALTNYLQGLVNRIKESPNVQNKDFNYVVTIIHDDNTINAFTLPGGPIYVYTGLMKYVDDEATLAGILAHEVTHADHRHSTQQLTKQYGLEEIANLTLGANDSSLVKQIALQVGGVGLLKFSRDDELEADANSFEDLVQLPGRPWYPAAINEFEQKMIASGAGNQSQFAKLFATHPPSKERLDAIAAKAKAANLPPPTAEQLNASGYRRYKAMLP